MDRNEAAAGVAAEIFEILPELRGHDLPWDRHLKDLGADSVERIEIIMGVVRRFRISAALNDFAALPDLDALVDHVVAHAAVTT